MVTPAAASLDLRLGADPGEGADGSRCEEPRLATRWDDGDAARLPDVRRDLADDLRGRDSQRARERRRGAHRKLHGLGEPARLTELADHAAEIEVALIEPRALDPRDRLTDRRPDGVRVLAVERVPRPHEHDLRAPPESLRRAHRGVDAEPARVVVRGGNDPAAMRISAHDERKLAQGGVLELLHCGVERVEVQMREDRHAHQGYGSRVIVSTPPPPTLVVPAAHQVSYGIVRGVAAPGARRLIVRIDGKVRRTRGTSTTGVRRRSGSPARAAHGPRRDRRRARTRQPGRLSATSTGCRRTARPRLRAARLDRPLQRSLRELADGFGRTSAIYVQDLTTGQGAAWNARATFPAASTLKLAIAVTALAHLDGPPRHGSTLDGLFRTMLVYSDNGSANRIETLIGGSTSGGSALVNATMRAIGLERTEMYGGYILNTSLDPFRGLASAGIPLAVDDQASWGRGKTTTAYDLARLARAVWLASGGLGPLRTAVPGFAPGEARYLLRVLADVRDHAKLDRLFGARSGVKVFHKAGWIGTARHDNGLVVWRGGIFVATVMTYRSGGAGVSSDVLAGRVAATAREAVRDRCTADA